MLSKRKHVITKSLSVAVLLTILLGIGATSAAFYHSVSLTNTLTTPTVEEEIVEDFGEGVSGNSKVKKVSFRNTGTADTFIRISFAETWKYTDESSQESLFLPDRQMVSEGSKFEIEKAAKIIWSNEFERDWVQGTDGWYYYKKVLPAGSKTHDIMTAVDFSGIYGKNWPDPRYLKGDYELYFTVESVQASRDLSVCVDAVETVFQKQIKKVTVNGNEMDVVDAAKEAWKNAYDTYSMTVTWPEAGEVTIHE